MQCFIAFFLKPTANAGKLEGMDVKELFKNIIKYVAAWFNRIFVDAKKKYAKASQTMQRELHVEPLYDYNVNYWKLQTLQKFISWAREL